MPTINMYISLGPLMVESISEHYGGALTQVDEVLFHGKNSRCC